MRDQGRMNRAPVSAVSPGRSTRAFERRFTLADHVRVSGATHENGMLHIDLVREVPEALKPRRIEIARSEPRQTDVIEADKVN